MFLLIIKAIAKNAKAIYNLMANGSGGKCANKNTSIQETTQTKFFI
jgi:hypothetical protein